ncbi:Reticulocyte-binding protein 2-like a [Durusdinium trenchii]|uniref:Reticulocyte-binding protein 2-like a n=1 Tax=Durusdinium trenchii TaxID=1381693 RepID=A0ABP0LPQ2_9DINO
MIRSGLVEAEVAWRPSDVEKSRSYSASSTADSSAGHATGRCQPCVFAQTQVGCPKGDQCSFCHLAHPRLCRRAGLRRGPRERITKRILLLFSRDNIKDAQAGLQAEALKNPYAFEFIRIHWDELPCTGPGISWKISL